MQEERALGVLSLAVLFLLLAVSASAQTPLERIVGPVIPMGQSPWPWYDKAEQANTDEILAAALANKPTLGPQAAGTFTLSDGCGITLTGPGVSEFQNGDWAVVAWDAPDGPGTGHFVFHNVTITGDTMTASDRCGLNPGLKAGTNLKVYHCKAGCKDGTDTYNPGAWGLNASWGINSWNYYDAGLAVYRVYLRTGNPKYLEQFRDLTDTWWLWALDQGSVGVSEPRNWSLVSQYVRALDGKPERLPALYAYMKQVMRWSWAAAVTPPLFDPRESGYLTMFLAVGARADSDPARHADYCAMLAAHVPQWLTTQNADGYWPEKNGGYAYRPPGTATWRMFAVLEGLRRAYEVLNDTTAAGCNNPTLAAQTLPAIVKAADFTYLYGRADNRGGFYDVQYPNEGQAGTNAGLKPGTVSINLGSSTVTGVGTNFRSLHACNGTTWMGIQHADGYTWTYPVASCPSDTQIILAGVWGDQGEKTAATNARHYHTLSAPTNCGASLAKTCWPAVGDRNLLRELIGPYGWLFSVTKDEKWRTRGDEFFSASYGGPAGGPGDTGPCGGPACDGIVTDYHASIHGCAFGPALPCNQETNHPPPGNVFQYLAKRYAQGSGMGGAANYLFWRLGGAAPTPPIPPPPPPLPSDPCVTSPLTFRVNRWPAQPTGARRFDYTASVPATIVLNLRVTPWIATATNAGGCVVTVTR